MMKKTLSFSKPLPEKLVAFKEAMVVKPKMKKFKVAESPEFEVIFYLNHNFPQIFSKKSPLPLKAGIHADLYPLLPKNFSKKAVRRALYLICKSKSYLQSVVKLQKRYDLNGAVVEDINLEHIETAKKTLGTLKK